MSVKLYLCLRYVKRTKSKKRLTSYLNAYKKNNLDNLIINLL